MAAIEKCPLITKREQNGCIELVRGVEWKVPVVIPIMTLTFISIGVESYTSTQWIHHYTKMDIFPKGVNNRSRSDDGCTASNHSDPDYILYERVQSESAKWLLWKNIACFVPAFFVTMVLPSYSDYLGRRFLFIIGIVGIFLQLVLESLAVYFDLGLCYFIAGSGVAGLFGGVFSIVSASHSYIADATRDGRRRSLAHSFCDGLMLICVTLSSIGCHYIITSAGYFLPFAVGGALTFIALLLTIFFLPETFRQTYRTESVNIFKVFGRTVEFYISIAFKRQRMAYIILISSFFLQEVVKSQRASIEIIYQLGMPLCWTTEKVATFNALRHAAQAFANIVVITPLKVCVPEITIAWWGALSNAGSFVMEGFVQTETMMYLVSLPAMFSSLTVPIIKSTLALMTPPDKVGSLFASLSALQSICGIVATCVTYSTYAATVTIMNGLVFLVLAGICVIVFVLLYVFGMTQSPEYNSEEKDLSVQG